MKLTILGCGTSSGVPRIGNDWGACDPMEPLNRRSRAAILIESATTRILVDSGPDLREQLLRADVGTFDAIIWTHDHADHTHGIDDLRQVFHNRRSPIPAYARPDTMTSLARRFGYAFGGNSGYPATLAGRALPDVVMIGDIELRATDQPHGGTKSAGLRFSQPGVAIGYATDFSDMTDDMAILYQELDIWVVDALRRAPHSSHPTLDQSLGWIADFAPGEAILTHMDQSMDYRTLVAGLPPTVVPGHDGLTRVVG
ncbi:MBL fold metallo-hydrolase [Sphingomonas montana]|uniref:MBL fold metallo-hydrolase n=1 Tax=Sphingomonas montana TaxID=1843236 RepID=UPI00096E36FA|nr:MBL fold metallo-hydrolase [Sphingomonas montana]